VSPDIIPESLNDLTSSPGALPLENGNRQHVQDSDLYLPRQVKPESVSPRRFHIQDLDQYTPREVQMSDNDDASPMRFDRSSSEL
jgi:hypothetical protein